MKWTRKQLLEETKPAIRKSYWRTAAVSALLLFIGNAISFTSLLENAERIPDLIQKILENEFNGTQQASGELIAVILTLIAGILVLGTLAQILIIIFGFNVLEIGCRRMFLRMIDPDDVGLCADIMYGFDQDYLNIVKVQLLSDLFIMIGYCLLVIPGVILSYEYRMAPYLLSENPHMPWREALLKSKQMMKGEKFRTLLLDLSFLPWHIFGALTLEVGEVLYVMPKKNLADADLYLHLKEKLNEE